MALKVYKPTTPARRKTSVTDFSQLSKKVKPRKSLLKTRKSNAGRNNQGRITVRHRGGGVKRKIRIIDFKQDKFDIPAKVESIEYDPNRGAHIARVVYRDGERRYILAPDTLEVGQTIVSSLNKVDIVVGNRMPLQYIPVGIAIYNIELNPGQGGKLVRGAGTSAHLMAIDGEYAQIKMPSSEIRLVKKECLASIGQASNPDRAHIRIGKAGRKRKLGIRPTVRGKAMNPNDHPHGGGEGRSPIGLKTPKTPWGKQALGVKTRKKHKPSDNLIIKRRKKKK